MKTLMNIGHKSHPWEASPQLATNLARMTPLFKKTGFACHEFLSSLSIIHLFNHSLANCARARDFLQFLANVNSWKY